MPTWYIFTKYFVSPMKTCGHCDKQNKQGVVNYETEYTLRYYTCIWEQWFLAAHGMRVKQNDKTL